MEDLVALAVETALFGAVSGLHCAAMCGPLAACAASGGPGAEPAQASSAAAGYHAARASGYVAAGALCGALGSGASWALGGALGPGLPWALAMLLLLGASGVLPRFGALPWLGPRAARLAQRVRHWTPLARAAALGALTPLLPCGLLVAAYSLALGSGSALSGAVALGSFALGSAPMLLAAQLGWSALRRGSLGRFAAPAQRALLLLAALTLLWRGHPAGVSCHSLSLSGVAQRH